MKVLTKITNRLETMFSVVLIIVLIGCGQTPSKKVDAGATRQQAVISNRKENPVKGSWVVVKAVDGYITGMSEDEANAIIGKTAVLTDSTFAFENDTLANVRFEVETVETIKYLMGYKTDPKKLGIHDEFIQLIGIFKMDDKSHNSVADLIWLNDMIVLSKNGYFFFLSKN